MSHPATKKNVALFVTCLVDLNRPSVAFAAVRLLEAANCTIVVPEEQTCCGQIAYNSGDRKSTKAFATAVLRAFAGFDYVVVPSGSCAGMMTKHYAELFEGDDTMMVAVQDLAARTYELTSFLHRVCGFTPADVRFPSRLAYHDSCSSLREMKVEAEPRALLSAVEGVELCTVDNAASCCGFGGTFCVKYPEISEAMVDAKVDSLLASGADTLAAGDLGCLMNIAGRLKRRGETMKVLHVAEILAGMGDAPGLGEGRR